MGHTDMAGLGSSLPPTSCKTLILNFFPKMYQGLIVTMTQGAGKDQPKDRKA